MRARYAVVQDRDEDVPADVRWLHRPVETSSLKALHDSLQASEVYVLRDAPVREWYLLDTASLSEVVEGCMLKVVRSEPIAPRPPKRIKIDMPPSDASKPHVQDVRDRLKCLLPSASQDAMQMAEAAVLLTGRPRTAYVSVAQRLALLSPEMAFLRDAASGVLLGDPPACYYDAWLEVQRSGPILYNSEGERQHAMITWQGQHFPGADIKQHVSAYSRFVMDSSSARQAKNDGELTVVWKDTTGMPRHQYWVHYLESKSEIGSSGDPLLQLARYMGASYGNNAERYDGGDQLLQATGCPALGVDNTGPNYMLYGMCLMRGNVVAQEPLTTRLPLLDCYDRWPDLSDMGARVLAAYDVALYYLQQRIRRAVPPGWVPLDTAADIVCREQQAQRVQQVLQSLRHPCVDYEAALKAVLLNHSQVASLAKQRQGMLCPLPWPLWGNCSASDNYHNIELLQLPGMPDKALFVGKRPSDQKAVVIKFTAGDYPDWIHEALHKEDLTTQLLECRVLPGGGCMVVTELLGDEWQNLGVLLQEMQAAGDGTGLDVMKAAIMPQLEKALDRVHKLHVEPPPLQSSGYSAMLSTCSSSTPSAGSSTPGSSNAWLESRRRKRVPGKVALGDARLANCMVKLQQDPATGQQQLAAVRFVDLDWAGVVGVATYPAVSISEPKHPGAGPHRPLSQEHDVYRLQHL